MYINTQIIRWIIISLIIFYLCFLFLTRPIPDLNSSRLDIKKVDKHNFINHKLLSGIDVSHYQGKVDWNKVFNDNIHFVYLKATDGITYTDPTFHKNQDSLIKKQLLHGAYHFFEPNDDGVKQAENFLSQVEIHKHMLRPVLDIEITQGIDEKLIKKRVKEWLETITIRLGCQPIIYSYSSFYENYLGNDFLEYPVWIADYNKKPTLPKDVTKFIIWQHTQKGNIAGIDTLVDKNLFFGDTCKLNAIKCNVEGEKKDE